ncbi:excisionase [Pectobacterium brasiliense]|uniref:Excisionase n=3 Tax=Pectobacterium TaxID=122277 RepID=A0AAW3SMW7_9GAMM|nr:MULTISPECIES: excisionase [Pectobacterium]MBA5202231.1 excisionase [Pectobacterium aroidearum]MBE5213238.1 excisionase [Pectobacterium quasiaquaticum]MBE5221645.1 excisionase [Pectobacterium quasiaquaticum]MBE5224112.1 excisionase [Pectobacterium quasiaquaticum]MDY4380384.1 excisionase [Pectobacterium brasiliense]
MGKLITLNEWGKRHYSNDSLPTIQTLQRWARAGKIYPAPEIQGREYRVHEDAVYINPKDYKLSRRIIAERKGFNSDLVRRIINGKDDKV